MSTYYKFNTLLFKYNGENFFKTKINLKIYTRKICFGSYWRKNIFYHLKKEDRLKGIRRKNKIKKFMGINSQQARDNTHQILQKKCESNRIKPQTKKIETSEWGGICK